MATQEDEFDGSLWFFTRVPSAKAAHIKGHQRVNVSYCDHETKTYVSVSGTAHVVQDREQIRAHWNARYNPWFPNGLEEPDLALLRVEVEEAEYWESPSSAVVKLTGFVKAFTSGRHVELMDHDKLELVSEPRP